MIYVPWHARCSSMNKAGTLRNNFTKCMVFDFRKGTQILLTRAKAQQSRSRSTFKLPREGIGEPKLRECEKSRQRNAEKNRLQRAIVRKGPRLKMVQVDQDHGNAPSVNVWDIIKEHVRTGEKRWWYQRHMGQEHQQANRTQRICLR